MPGGADFLSLCGGTAVRTRATDTRALPALTCRIMNPISLRALFTLTARVSDPPSLIGPTSMGYSRRIMRVSDGHFAGERLNGIVVPGGGDALIIRPDGVLVLDVRLTLQTDQGEFIYLTYGGRRGGSKDIVERIGRGEIVPPGSDYYRITASFEAPRGRLAWLNDIVAVGTGTRTAQAAVYELFEVM